MEFYLFLYIVIYMSIIILDFEYFFFNRLNRNEVYFGNYVFFFLIGFYVKCLGKILIVKRKLLFFMII